MASRRDKWVTARMAELMSLKGESAVAWYAEEMALFGGDGDDDGPPHFSVPYLPLLQLNLLICQIGTGDYLSFSIYQNSSNWGIYLVGPSNSKALVVDFGCETSIFRTVPLSCLPCGQIESVDIFLDEDRDINQVTFNIGAQRFSIVAGEVYPQNDGSLRVVRFDESILLFPDAGDVEKVDWANH